MDKLYALIQKTPMAQKAAAVGLLLALIVGGHYYFVYRDQAKNIKRLGIEKAKLEEDLQEKQEIANNLSKFKKKVEYLQQKLEEKKKNLPNDANMDQLLKTLNELSEKSDIRILKFTPQSEVRRNFYAEIPVSMELEGNYHEIATFFDKIAKEERIINVSDIGMGKPEVKSGKVVLKAECTAKTFRAIAQKKGAKKAAGKKKSKKKR